VKQRVGASLGKDLSNRHVILLALLLQGGATGYVDIEDVAAEAYRIAPTRFRWTRYDYPSLETARVAFKHWKDRKDEEPRVTEHRKTYVLTGLGVQDAISTAKSVFQRDFSSADDVISFYKESETTASATAQKAVSASMRTTSRPSQHELRRIKAHDVFKGWRTGELRVELWQIADVLNCLPDSAPRVWDERFSRLNAMATFWQDDDMIHFLAALKEQASVKQHEKSK
jgi:hypothetical protein